MTSVGLMLVVFFIVALAMGWELGYDAGKKAGALIAAKLLNDVLDEDDAS